MLGAIWDLPSTAIGVAFGGVGLALDAVVGVASFGKIDLGASVTLSGGILHFENPLARGGAITLGGRAINYQPGQVSALMPHELNHVPQARALGPFYLPANAIGMAASLGHYVGRGFSSAGWISPVHGPANFMERGPLQGRPWP